MKANSFLVGQLPLTSGKKISPFPTLRGSETSKSRLTFQQPPKDYNQKLMQRNSSKELKKQFVVLKNNGNNVSSGNSVRNANSVSNANNKATQTCTSKH